MPGRNRSKSGSSTSTKAVVLNNERQVVAGFYTRTTGRPLTAVQALLKEIRKTNFYGTPTIFIDGTFYVGPKPYRVYAIALEGLFYWLKK